VGVILQNSGQVEEAVRHYGEALKARPAYANARFNLGAAYVVLGRPAEALSQYQQAVRLKPSELSWRMELGGLLAQQGRLDEAMAQYREVVLMKPGYADAYNSLGAALFLKKDFAAAWAQVKLCRKYGGKPSAGLLSALSRYMPEPRD
jgi:tetratricopeptide (TPR) repeat protein